MPLKEFIPYISIGVPILLLLIIIISGYVKAPTDMVYIISGMRKKPRYLSGKSGIKIPFLQRVDKLSLRMLSVDVKTEKTIPTLDYINIMVDSVANVKVSLKNDDNGKPLVEAAAQNFLNKNEAYINNMIVSVLEGNLREIIGSMKLVDIMNDRKTFAAKVQENAKPDMERMGLEIVSFNIQNIDDHGLGVIDNLGIANTVAIRQTAEISKANAEKEIAVAQAEAKQLANDARVKSETSIAEKNTELSLKKSELQTEADTAQAKADAAHDIEAQKQQKSINTELVNAQIAQAEREADLRDRQISIKERELDANVKKQADADKYAAEKKAEAELVQRQREADAQKYEQERAAEAKKAQADAERYLAEQTAAGIRAKGEAEAEAARAKYLAEAEGMEKKAEAYKKYNGAAMAEMMIKILPDMAKAIAEPVGNISNLNIYDAGGNGSGEPGAAQVSGLTPVVMTQTFDVIKQVTGVDLADIMRANTYDAKVNKNVNVSGIPTSLDINNVNIDAND
ncbi:MAG: flotillin family protein [Lachnospiraceae bacterium]|nr:flotillin family protein [Lachnospiraceae bacterium]